MRHELNQKPRFSVLSAKLRTWSMTILFRKVSFCPAISRSLRHHAPFRPCVYVHYSQTRSQTTSALPLIEWGNLPAHINPGPTGSVGWGILVTRSRIVGGFGAWFFVQNPTSSWAFHPIDGHALPRQNKSTKMSLTHS
jgi:hypothetical protein